ncbi:MAG: hypothetical protein L6V91_08315 [Bacilli bacterium]|nr:MAG: hypothetical protein L6V91_08315 [Bacilli bacterium]
MIKKLFLDYFIKGDKLLYGIASDYTEKNKERIGEIFKKIMMLEINY